MIANVAIDDTTRAFDKLYSYKIPDGLELHPGMFVDVPFAARKKKFPAIVIEIKPESEIAPNILPKLKEIQGLDDKKLSLNQTQIDLVKWMKEKYICTYFDAIKCISPAYSAKEIPNSKFAILNMTEDELSQELESLKINKIHQRTVLEMFLTQHEMPVNYILQQAGVSISVLNTLAKNGYIYFEKRLIKEHEEEIDFTLSDNKEIILTDEQEEVLSTVKPYMQENKFAEFLLYGVTGSGKSEVFFNLIQHALNLNKTAIMLVPEISLTPLMTQRLKQRFGNDLAILHSRLSLKEKKAAWNDIENDKVKIVLGARSAIFAPIKRLGLIIIDEEHESTYKSETVPRYNTSEIARFLTYKNNAVFLSASATPSLESYSAALAGKAKLLTMLKRPANSVLPNVSIVNMAEELANGNRKMFSNMLIEEIRKNIENGEQTMLFLNKRGFSSFMMCRSCGEVVNCPNCNVSMTYHKNLGHLVCHYCGKILEIPKVCSSCGDTAIGGFGTGTQRVEEQIQELFPGASIIRMDYDTTTGHQTHKDLLVKFKKEKIDILIGTQMIAKGHDFENVTLVGVLAADSMLYASDYRSSEKAFQLITQVSGRAGRGEKEGRVVLQTYNPDHYAIECAAKQDYQEFFKKEMMLRKISKYPPYGSIGLVVIKGINKNDVIKCGNEIIKLISNYINEKQLTDIETIGPYDSPISKINKRERMRIIIKSVSQKQLRLLLTHVDANLTKGKYREVIVTLDINPYNMS